MSWIETLTEVVKSHWSSTGRALLLSQVKRELAKRGIDLVSALEGRKLKDALVEEGGSDVRLVRNPLQPLVWGLLPSAADAPGELGELFGPLEDKTVAASRAPRFGRGVWLAFAKPLKIGCRRFLEVGPPSRMFDIPDGGMPPPAGVEIDPSFIYNPSGELVPNEHHEAQVEKNIREWALHKGIELEKLLASAPAVAGKAREGAGHFDIADFSGLSSSEKARILIPLDLLSKIRFGR